ncbi:MAG TPA: hypothetical protein PLY72_09185, partial [Candidatus Obscuribacter sp.]|nr:hypothetical protein [Candidatus Obscuribacter sp.]
MTRLFGFMLAATLLSGLVGVNMAASGAKPSGVPQPRAGKVVSRALVFPAQVSVGKLYFYVDAQPGDLPWHCDVVFAKPGSGLGDARGVRTFKLPE